MAVERAIAKCMAETTKGEYRSGHDQRTLRDALGCFATGVTVVTCVDEEERPAGLTVNSFTSVSLDPPLLLVCLHKMAASSAALTAASHFAINVLQTEQQPASITFSTRVEDRFGSDALVVRRGGRADPRGIRCASSSASATRVYDGGDHHILVGQVDQGELRRRPRSPALLSRPVPAAALRLVDDQFLQDAW